MKVKKGVKLKCDKKILWILLTNVIVTVFIVVLGFCIYDNYFTNRHINTNNRNIKIDDTGLANAVDKVYDSVVVVDSYTGDKIYANGSGFVFKTDILNGYILTNKHVLNKASAIKVVFSNKKEVYAEIVGSDNYSDIAVLKVDKKYIKEIAIMGDNSKTRVGETTFTIGAPLDPEKYSWSITRGVLSGKNRTVLAESGYMNVLQTDTAINTGNSGGPLCNANGEVIGITNMRLSENDVEGMGFAIPIETALDYANKFIEGQNITRPYLGIKIKQSRKMFSSASKIVVLSVDKDSPAAKAGIKNSDILLEINGEEIKDEAYLKHQIYKFKKGKKIEITIKRDGKEKKIPIILDERKDTEDSI